MDKFLTPKKSSTAEASPKGDFGKKSAPVRGQKVGVPKDKTETTTLSKLPSPSSARPSKRKLGEEDEYTDTQAGRPRPTPGQAKPKNELPPLPDTIVPNLLCLFVGLNPGIETATKGHPYAHPSNLYWKLLHWSGLTPDRRLAPAEYVILPEQYTLGNTNIVGRATKSGADLNKAEMVVGAGVLDEKVRKSRPEVVCLVGKSIWEAVWKWKHGRAIKSTEFHYGFQAAGENMGRVGGLKGGQEAKWSGARVFVATTTSGLAAGMSLQEKKDIWAELGVWVNERRDERKRIKDGANVSKEEKAEQVEPEVKVDG